MEHELAEVFKELTPPPGGWNQVRARLAPQRARVPRYWLALALPVATAALALLLVGFPRAPNALRQVNNPALVRLAMVPPPPHAVSPQDASTTAVLPVSTDAQVTFYWVDGR